MKDMTNLETGTRIIVEKSNNNLPMRYQKIPLVIRNNVGSGYYGCSLLKNRSVIANVHHSTHSGYRIDEFILATRKGEAKILKSELDKIKKDIAYKEERIAMLEEYESDDEYLLDKIEEISEGNKTKTKKINIIKQIKKILSEQDI